MCVCVEGRVNWLESIYWPVKACHLNLGGIFIEGIVQTSDVDAGHESFLKIPIIVYFYEVKGKGLSNQNLKTF